MLQKYKYYCIWFFAVVVASCLLSIVNSAPVNCKAFDAARWRMINLKLCQTAQSLTHKGGDTQPWWGERGVGGGRAAKRHFLDYKNCNRLMPAT